jgi:hypothetical protein
MIIIVGVLATIPLAVTFILESIMAHNYPYEFPCEHFEFVRYYCGNACRGGLTALVPRPRSGKKSGPSMNV